MLLASTLVGCGSAPFSGSITLTPDPGFRESSGLLPTVQVDLIGVTALELQRWTNYPVTSYWSSSDELRNSALRQTFLMTTAEPGPFVLSRWADIVSSWKKKGVTSVVFIADLPGAWQPRPPKAEGAPPPGVTWFDPEKDPRRLVIPWVQSAYGAFSGNIDVSVRPQRLSLQTPVDMSKAVPAAGK